MAFTASEYWRRQDQQRYQTPTHNRLNPVVTDFQPNGHVTGNEMQRWSQLPPTPPSERQQPLPAELLQMRNYMLQTHFVQTRDVTTLERQIQQHDEDIQHMHKMVGNDVRALQSELANLRDQVQGQKQQDGMLARYSRADQVVAPPDEFTQNFSKQRIAEVYLEEADDYEKAALKLKEQAKEICGEAVLALEGHETHTHRPARRATGGAERKEGGNQLTSPETKEETVLEVEKTTPMQVKPGRNEVSAEGVTKSTQAAAATTPTIADQSWIPLAIRQMPPAQAVATRNSETFTFDLIKSELGGAEWSPGFYFVQRAASQPDLPIRSYWLLESEFEPFLPTSPGLHGAKLTAFFNETIGAGVGHFPTEEDYDNVPVFISTAGMKKGGYKYFGHYRQTRYSDRVDMDHLLTCIPEEVRRYHAEQLADTGRPAWVTEALKQHFWPKDEYVGPLPTDSAINTPCTEVPRSTCSGVEKRVMEALIDYANDLKEREKEANIKVNLLTAETLMQAFSKADADEEPGLRLNLEYFQFLQYEQGFYDYLVKIQNDPKRYERPAVEASKATQPKKPVTVGGKMIKPPSGVSILHPTPAPAANKVRLSDKAAIPTEESEQRWVEDKEPRFDKVAKTESVKTAVRTTGKNQAQGVQAGVKNEKDAKPVDTGMKDSLIASGNLEAAKVLQKEFKSGGVGKEKGKKGGPPHLRG